MKNILLLSFCFMAAFSFGQTKVDSNTIEIRKIDTKDYTRATFPGGNDVFTKLVYSKFNYSTIDESSDELQRTTIEFIVEKDGTLTNIKAIGTNERLNNEGIRIVKSITEKWQPATLNGEKVRMKFKQPIKLVVQ